MRVVFSLPHSSWISSGVLHDVIEATAVTAGDLRERFGAQVAKLVLSVSENPRIAGYAMRKAALRRQVADAGEETLALFAADKIFEAARAAPCGSDGAA